MDGRKRFLGKQEGTYCYILFIVTGMLPL